MRRFARLVPTRGRQTASFAELFNILGLRPDDEQLTRPAAQVRSVRRCLGVITDSVAALEWSLTRVGDDAPLYRGPAFELLSRPAPDLNWRDIAAELAGNLVHRGAAFVADDAALADPAAWNGKFQTLRVLGQDRMTPERPAGRLLWWRYTPRHGGAPIPLPPAYVPYIRTWNPDDDDLGLGALDAAEQAIRTEWSAGEHLRRSLVNGAQPTGFYVFEESLQEEELERFRREIQARHAGSVGANKFGVLSGGVRYEKTGWSNVDLDLRELAKMTTQGIYEAYGVPSVYGSPDDSAHYNTAKSAQQIFVHTVVQPIAALIEELFNRWILPTVEAGVELHLDIDSHWVVQEANREKAATLTQLLQSGVPYNDAVAFLRLPFAAQDWGDRSLVAAGLSTVDDVLAGLGALPQSEGTGNREQGTEEEAPQEDDSDASSWRLGALAAHEHESRERGAAPLVTAAALADERKAEERQIQALVPGLRATWRRWLIGYEQRTLAKLRKAAPAKGTGNREQGTGAARSIATAESERLAREIVLDAGAEHKTLAALVRAYFPRSVQQALLKELERLGVPAGERESLAAKGLRERLIRRVLAVKVNRITTVERTLRRRIQAALVRGLDRGETVQQLADRVRQVSGGVRAHALRIARTEAGQAVSTARYAAASAAGATGKGWLHGRNPRGTHLAAQRRYHPRSGAIPMAEAFDVGGFALQYPRDPAGPPQEIINCNCVLVSVRLPRRKDEAATLVNVIGAADVHRQDAKAPRGAWA